MRCAFLFLSLVVAGGISHPNAHADATNRNLLPIGEREAFLANTGITSASGGAVFHNPGNLARVPHPTISLSGTTILRFSLFAEEYIGDKPLKAKGFVVIPGALISTYELGEFRLATAILVPDSFEFQDKASYDLAPELKTTVLLRNLREDFWIGGGLARQFGRLSLGLSVFGIRRSQTSLMLFNNKSTTMANVGGQFVFDTASTVYGVSAIAGALVALNDVFSIGMRVQSPFLQVKSRADIYLSLVSNDPMNSSAIDSELEDIKFRDPLPWDMGIGIRVTPRPALSFMVDGSLQTGLRYTAYEGLALFSEMMTDTRRHLKPAPRVSFGAEWSATPSLFGGTAGLMWESGRTTTGLGFYFARSNGSLRPAADPTRTADAHATLLGALITVRYQL
jgi:hypothetical protein